jgi:hypothetical protein
LAPLPSLGWSPWDTFSDHISFCNCPFIACMDSCLFGLFKHFSHAVWQNMSEVLKHFVLMIFRLTELRASRCSEFKFQTKWLIIPIENIFGHLKITVFSPPECYWSFLVFIIYLSLLYKGLCTASTSLLFTASYLTCCWTVIMRSV